MIQSNFFCKQQSRARVNVYKRESGKQIIFEWCNCVWAVTPSHLCVDDKFNSNNNNCSDYRLSRLISKQSMKKINKIFFLIYKYNYNYMTSCECSSRFLEMINDNDFLQLSRGNNIDMYVMVIRKSVITLAIIIILLLLPATCDISTNILNVRDHAKIDE